MNSTYIIIAASIAAVAGITIATFLISEPEVQPTVVVEEEYDEVFSIGTVSSDAAKMIKRYQPTADYIAEKLSGEKLFKGKVIITKTIEDMEELLENQEIDLYYDSPFPTVYITEETDAKVLVKRWKEKAESYNSVAFVKKDSEIQGMVDMPGTTIVFQGEESTTGFMLPITKLLSKGYRIGFDMNNQIDYVFSGDDENTAHWVIEGKGESGAVSNLDFDDFPMDIKEQLRIIWETEHVPRQLVIHRSDMNPEMIHNVKEILLTMHETQEGLEILEEFKHTAKYTDFGNEEYEEVANMLKSLPPGIID